MILKVEKSGQKGRRRKEDLQIASFSSFFPRTLSANMADSSLLEIVGRCHNHNPWQDDSLHPFLLTPQGPQLGFLPPSVFDKLSSSSQDSLIRISHKGKPGFSFSEKVKDEPSRSKVLAQLAQKWREGKVFPDPLDGWRDELYDVYGPNRQVALKFERSACALFGFATFGVHLTAYTQEEMKIWVPRRSKTKST